MKKLSRRDALKLIGLTTASGVLAACSPKATPTAVPEAPKPAPTTAAVEPAPTTAAVVEPTPTAVPAPVEVPEIEIKLSLWDIANSFPEGQEPDAIAKHVMDKFKIKFTPVNVGWGDADEKYNTWAASGQLPDVVGALAMVGTARYFQWINDGVLRPLSDFSAYPEVSRLMSFPDVNGYAVEGKNYFLPRLMYSDPAYWAMDRGLLVRKDWMEKVGIDPKTEQDYIDMCVAFAKSDPDGNGQADTNGYTPEGDNFSQIWAGFGDTDVMHWGKEADGTYQMPVATERALKLAQFLKNMFKAGGMDPDFATLESGQAIEKFATSKTGLLGRQVSPKHIKKVFDAWIQVEPDKDFVETVAILPGPTVDGSFTRFSLPSYWSESYFSANVDDAKMDRIIQMYDWLYTKEAMYMVQYGMEGKDFTVENGNVVLQTPVDAATGQHQATSDIYPFTYAMNYLAAWAGDYLQYDDPTIPEGIRKMCAVERDNRVANWKDPQINWAVQAIDVPEKQEMAAVLFSEDWTSFIMDATGKPDQELYEAMKANWDANGYAAAVEAITAKAKELGIG